MKHFSSEEWRSLGQGLNRDKDMVMEKHLLECDACLQLFLEGIDANAMEEAKFVIPPDFATRTCDLIRASARQEPRYTARFQRKGLLAYYAAAAVITIMMTSGGLLQSLNNTKINLPLHPDVPVASKYEDILFKWPAQLQEKTAGWLNTINLESYKEVK
ncbi:MAG: hypothetical protein PHX14_10060 [Syntrophomonadaceae bacterium]|nr:hypothetical protein [Syntrophomonadaceae bacterium]